MKTIVIADDHSFVIDGLNSILKEHGYHVIATAQNANEVRALSQTHKPDIWLLDCDMPGSTSVELLSFLKIHLSNPKVVYFTGKIRGEEFRQLAALGIRGLVSKTESIHDLLQALSNTSPDAFISKRIQALLPSQTEQLSPKEIEALSHFVQAKTNIETADLMGISNNTVKIHRKNIMKKLDIHKTVDLIKILNHKGWL